MIKSVFHLFKIHWKVVFGNPAVVVQNMLGIAPKSFNPVNVVLAAVGKGLAVIQAVMLAPALQGVVASEGVRVVYRPLSGMLSDMGHQFISRNLLHHLGVNPSIPLQKAEYDAFTRSASAALALSLAAKIALVYLNLTLQSAGFQLRHMIDGLAQVLVDAGHHLVIQVQIAGDAISRLLLVKAGENANLFAQSFKRLLFSTTPASAFHIAPLSPVDFERATENTLSTPQKVGRTIKNALLTSNHKGILTPRGYEIH